MERLKHLVEILIEWFAALTFLVGVLGVAIVVITLIAIAWTEVSDRIRR